MILFSRMLNDRAIGPTFETDEQAQKFADWCNGVIPKFN
jgi:hypothetical protein